MGAAFNFDMHFQYPGQGSNVEEVMSPYGLKWGKPFSNQFRQVRISGAARDAGNTGYTDVLRPGLLMGIIASSGLAVQWDPTATDGSHRIAGILYQAVKTTMGGTNTNRLFSMIVGGSVPAKGIAIASSANWGISGNAQEYNIRSQMQPAFQFPDDPLGFLTGDFKAMLILAASTTLTTAHAGSHIVVRGAAGAVNLTLPATPYAGLRYRVTNASDQNLTITAGTPDTMVVLNDLTADSVALSTASEKIGGTFEIIGDGTGWLVIPSLWETQTQTIAT